MRVEARALGRSFGRVAALREVSFDVPSGRRVALVGPNGSGKSTLNRVLVGLLEHEGEVRLDGMPPRPRRLEVARRISYLPQVAPRLAAPVRELVRAVTSLRGTTPAAVAARAASLGLDLEAVAPRPLRGLSGGMRQKLLLALALAAPASLLVLDEPTGSLDPATRERFFAAFDALAGDATVLLCSHRLEEVRSLVQHVLVLEEGRLVHDGPVDAFLDACASHTLDVRAEGEAARRWLRDEGFRETHGGWWRRTADSEEKRRLVRGIAQHLDGSLRDLEVRPLETLDLERARREPPEVQDRG